MNKFVVYTLLLLTGPEFQYQTGYFNMISGTGTPRTEKCIEMRTEISSRAMDITVKIWYISHKKTDYEHDRI